MRPRVQITVALAIVVATTGFHFLTDPHAVEFHNFYRRLYYLPIVLGAFAYGTRGGIGVALAATAAYAPHAFFAAHRDPSPTVDKALEIVLFIVIGALTGWLVDRERGARRRLERSLEERERLETQLIRAGRLSALGELVAGVAHEVRNPLASIKGSADAIADEFDETHRKHRLVQIMQDEIERLERVVSKFLDFARPSTPVREPVDLLDISRQAANLAKSAPGAERTTIEVVGEPLRIDADSDQLLQVVLNLVLNAVRAVSDTTDPKITVTVLQRATDAQRRACIRVDDNGPGIPDEMREQIFDPFFTTFDDGTGLGLSISNRIAEAHDGFIDVESSPSGSTFWLCFETGEQR